MIHLLRLRANTTRLWMISAIWCYHSRGLEYCSSGGIHARQPSLGLYCCCWPGCCRATRPSIQLNCCIANVTLFSRVTLIWKLHSTSDLDHLYACDLPCSCVKSREDLIMDCGVDSAVPYSFIYIHRVSKKGCHSNHGYNFVNSWSFAKFFHCCKQQ